MTDHCPSIHPDAAFIPSQLADSTAFDLPSLPVHSWTAAITLHTHRLAESLGIPPDSSMIVGLDTFVNGLKSIDGWAGWIGDELGQRIGWDGIKVSSVRQSRIVTSC